MGLLDKSGQDMKITIRKPNGASVTYHSPQGSQMDMMGVLGGMVQCPEVSLPQQGSQGQPQGPQAPLQGQQAQQEQEHREG